VTLSASPPNPAYRAAAQSLAEGKIAEGLRKLDKMGAVVEIENPTARRAQMVDEWFAASQETKTVRTQDGTHTRTKTALIVAPTWAEIDALNAHARAKLRAAGKIIGDDIPSPHCTRRTGQGATKRCAELPCRRRARCAQATKHFQKNDELRVVRREKRRLIVARGAEEFSVSPRQSGRAWTVCEERAMPVASGDAFGSAQWRACKPPTGRFVELRTVRMSSSNPQTLSVAWSSLTVRHFSVGKSSTLMR